LKKVGFHTYKSEKSSDHPEKIWVDVSQKKSQVAAPYKISGMTPFKSLLRAQIKLAREKKYIYYDCMRFGDCSTVRNPLKQ
jgi:hypothetical protein